MGKILSLPELRHRLLELNNNAELPFSVIEKGKELIASWKIVDAKWIELLGLGGIKKQYELILRFDEEHKQVSYKEKSIDIDTELSTDNISYKKEVRYGNRKEFSFGGSWGIKADGTVGKQYTYKFSTSDIKNPVFDIIKGAGWLLKQKAIDKYGLQLLWLVCIFFIVAVIIFNLL
ncbi:hypothetical protein MXL39_12735 [Enterobacter sichuanensis]|uniref:hypothetical protein n=1 Tax=Enterobacter sichuanensis TaxID=2071710 RepID=UPI002DC0558E|nr:hypothetical protein [Enterobacter sichuanensis]MEB5961103.1 hypothetical protein [Enterobacter sichuanensis]